MTQLDDHTRPVRPLAACPGPLPRPRPASPPTAVLIRQQRAPMSRAKKLSVLVGVPLGIAGVALAASFAFSTITSTTAFEESTADARITAVSGTRGTSGVDCRTAAMAGPDAITAALTAKRLTIPRNGNASEIAVGTCVITVQVENTGTVPVTPTLDVPTAPDGWAIGLDRDNPVTIHPGQTAPVPITVEAQDGAQAGNIIATLSADAELPAEPAP